MPSDPGRTERGVHHWCGQGIGIPVSAPDYAGLHCRRFDSVKKEVVDYYREETHAGIREYNPVKDASDTEIAIRLAMTLGGTDLVILGATGGRIDHLWANVQSLAIPFKAGVHARSWTVRTGSFFWERGKPILRRVRHMGRTFRFFRWEMKCLASRSKERNIRCMIMC